VAYFIGINVKHVPILGCKPAKVGNKPAKPWAQEDQEGNLLIPEIRPEEGSGRS
jgi:hypothetical protein